MLRFLQVLSIFFVIIGISDTAQSQDFYVYPKAGQDNQTMEKDKFECYQWAKQQTGYDPSRGPVPINLRVTTRPGEILPEGLPGELRPEQLLVVLPVMPVRGLGLAPPVAGCTLSSTP